MIVSASSSQSIEIDSERGRRVVLVVLSLMGQIEAINRGKLTLSWGPQSGVKWCVESHGMDGDAIAQPESIDIMPSMM